MELLAGFRHNSIQQNIKTRLVLSCSLPSKSASIPCWTSLQTLWTPLKTCRVRAGGIWPIQPFADVPEPQNTCNETILLCTNESSIQIYANSWSHFWLQVTFDNLLVSDIPELPAAGRASQLWIAQLDRLVADATLLPKAYWAPWYQVQWLLFTDLSFDTDAMVFVMSTIFF